MKRVLVIGKSGSGKSTLSQKLGRKLDLEVLHLDKFYWRSGWSKTPADEWLQAVARLVGGESWVIDGNYSGTLPQRIEACDTIVFLDLPVIVCLWRIAKRWLLYRHASRPDMAEGCPEKINIEFILWVLGYSRGTRPKVVKLIQENTENKTIVWLRSRKEVNRFLEI